MTWRRRGEFWKMSIRGWRNFSRLLRIRRIMLRNSWLWRSIIWRMRNKLSNNNSYSKKFNYNIIFIIIYIYLLRVKE